MIIRFGIADAHGIETYVKEEELEKGRTQILRFRADANRQRHAVVYRAEVTPTTDAKIIKKIEEKNWQGALLILKKEAVSICFPQGNIGYENSWSMIPNPKLDPWRS